jgi:gamma-butyrobetaine dioxygenase
VITATRSLQSAHSSVAGPSNVAEAHVIQQFEGAPHGLVVHWADGHRSVFHYIWLRDNCHCAACGNAATGYRALRVVDISPDIAPARVELDGVGNLNILWKPGQHESQYQAAWLRRNCYSAAERARRRHRPKLWDASLAQFPEISHAEMTAGDEGHLRMLELVRDYGLALVRGVSPAVGELEKVAALVGYIQESSFGRVFDIIRTAEQKSIANSMQPLMPHTDQPYRYRAPGPILFHCIQANPNDGGVSTYVDGFNVAEVLRRENPAAFECLSRYAIPYRRWYTDEVDMQAASPMISVDQDGNVVGVRFNDRVAAPLVLPEEVVEPFYAAFIQLARLYERKEFLVQVGLYAGDLMIIDNDRILHGRTGFTGNAGPRHIRQAHVDRTDFHSQLRILGRRLGRADAELDLAPGAVG